jgi:magnesium chelatase subunit I
LKELREIQGLFEKLRAIGVKSADPAPKVVAAAEFLLEGLVAHRKLSRNEDRGFAAPETTSRKEQRPDLEVEYEDWQRARRSSRRGGFN